MTRLIAGLRRGWPLTAVLSVIAGAVDVIGFLALGGLFTAHITGNVVILAAHYVTGRFSQVGPLLAVPVFIIVLGLVTLASETIERADHRENGGEAQSAEQRIAARFDGLTLRIGDAQGVSIGRSAHCLRRHWRLRHGFIIDRYKPGDRRS